MRSRWFHPAAVLVILAGLWLQALPAQAVTLIRDAEIERSLRELATPLMAAAGVNPARVDIWVIEDSKLNAFVADPQTIVIHSGLLLRLETPQQVQAVLAHELAHIANGHISRRIDNMRAMNRFARMGLILAAAAGAATGSPEAAIGLGAGAAGAARRAFFGHTRAEEAAADRSSIRYMTNAGVSPVAMVEVLNIFRGQEALSPGRQDPYLRTHPLTRDRLRAAEGFAAASPPAPSDQSEAAYWYARLQGKLSAFLRNPDWTLRRVPPSDRSEVAVMRRAIAYHKKPDPDRAAREVEALLALRPDDPYYTALKGQFAFESRRYDAAVAAYERAVSLAPREPLLLAQLGRAYLAQNTAASNRKALEVLAAAYGRDAGNPSLLRDLAQAYARAGQNGMASVTTAERHAMSGRVSDAGLQARRAMALLPQGSPGYARARDILRTAEQAEARR
ncbi:peptidase M48 Ste24p [Dinoroseobacter shibae DFL 12 = DSM 16493]|jgi:predicted Zn-dependent protease|uniref:Peptidase M48 Ste24p n=1 Tax=Dinoroseobacter shibae (strain DSM 16493 / NCIMB 14021 / DFL 12) TaxID=398580 RepID=A8LHW2_DINSH|nr:MULTISPECIES: M48 family metalloprotease [Dinoroseobacter]ABV92909.1 peptidase M48 Ste24p [Dinoroseobacter shibae DFL 12 = DSM 16493]URF47845.1 M48 family metalloprotease [Dinoroseobacter shibae]URF52154.1 M48 family metalloprotease [Dinoroseobacter shibae]